MHVQTNVLDVVEEADADSSSRRSRVRLLATTQFSIRERPSKGSGASQRSRKPVVPRQVIQSSLRLDTLFPSLQRAFRSGREFTCRPRTYTRGNLINAGVFPSLPVTLSFLYSPQFKLDHFN